MNFIKTAPPPPFFIGNMIYECTSDDVNVGLEELIDSLLAAIRIDLNSEQRSILNLNNSICFCKIKSTWSELTVQFEAASSQHD